MTRSFRWSMGIGCGTMCPASSSSLCKRLDMPRRRNDPKRLLIGCWVFWIACDRSSTLKARLLPSSLRTQLESVMGMKSSNNYQSDRPESGGADKDGTRENNGLL